MAIRIILLAVVIVALIGIFGNLTSQGGLSTAVKGLQASVVTVAYAGEVDQIRDIVNDFMRLRTMSSADAQELAADLDNRINNLELTKIYCEEKISTLELASLRNPYDRLQELCPALNDVSIGKAAQLFSMI